MLDCLRLRLAGFRPIVVVKGLGESIHVGVNPEIPKRNPVSQALF